MYRHLPIEVWRSELGLTSDEEAPRALIVHGELSPRRAFGFADGLLCFAHEAMHSLRIGRYKGVPIAIANVYGATLAADLTFIVVQAGAKLVVQTGWFGGLDAGQGPDAILIPDSIASEDGVARQFRRRGPIVPSESAGLRAVIGSLGCVTGGTLVSTCSITAETDRTVARWAKAGRVGVDLESAATVATAQALGARAGCCLHVVDNLIRHESFYHESVIATAAAARRDERLRELLQRVSDYVVAEVG